MLQAIKTTQMGNCKAELMSFRHVLNKDSRSTCVTCTNAQNSVTIQRANETRSGLIDENTGTNLQAFYEHFYIDCLSENTKTAITF